MKLRISIWDILVGLPAGTLVFMSTMMFGALLRRIPGYPDWLDLLVLAIDAAIVGGLVRLSRASRAVPTALAAGFFAAATLLYLRLSAQSGDTYSAWLFGAPGILLSLLIPPLAARYFLANRAVKP